MELDKYELQTLKYLSFYKIFSISIMIISCLLTMFGFYVRFFTHQTDANHLLHNALLGAAITILAGSYLMFHFLKIIEKLKQKYR